MIKNYISSELDVNNKYKRIIGLDLDGVLGDLLNSILDEVYVSYGIRIRKAQITNYFLEKCTYLSSEQLNEIFSKQIVFQKMKPVPYAIRATKHLHEIGWSIHIVTDRSKQLLDITINWLSENGFYWDKLALVNAKDKAKYAKEYMLYCFVEDRHDVANSLSRVCPLVYLFDKAYNQGSLESNLIRVSSWEELLKDFLIKI